MYKVVLLVLGVLALQQVLYMGFAGTTPLVRQEAAAASPVWEQFDPRSPNNRNNPYASEYGALDSWLQHHNGGVVDLRLVTDPAVAGKYQSPWREYPDGSFVLNTRMVGGFPLPLREHLGRYLKAQAEDRVEDYMLGAPLLCATGRLNAKQRRMLEQMVWESQAESFPRVPRWLVANPPLRARLLPDGEVLAWGAPGSGKGLSASEIDQRAEQVGSATLYGPAGLVLASGMPETWLPLCDRLDHGRLSTLGELRLTPDRYLELRASEDGKLLGLWDYDGREMPLDSERLRRAQAFRWLRSDEISALYAAQSSANTSVLLNSAGFSTNHARTL